MTNTPPPVGGYQAAQPLSPSDERLWSTLVHIGGIFFSFVPALIGFLVLKDRGPFVRAHTLTALNFQISFAIYAIAASIISVVTFGIGAILFLPIGVLLIVFPIIAAIAANAGRPYSYPLTIPIIK